MIEPFSVLVVEDNDVIRTAISDILKQKNLRVHAATTMGEALDLIDSRYFESAYVDALIDPGQSQIHRELENSHNLTGGIWVAKYLHQKDERCRIIVATGLNQMIQQVARSGAWAYYNKREPSILTIPDLLEKGALVDREIGQETMDLRLLVGGYYKERK